VAKRASRHSARTLNRENRRRRTKEKEFKKKRSAAPFPHGLAAHFGFFKTRPDHITDPDGRGSPTLPPAPSDFKEFAQGTPLLPPSRLRCTAASAPPATSSA